MFCFKCQKKLEDPIDGRVQFKEVCFYCQQDLHCCLNCRFYKRGAPNDCVELNVELVSDKERFNYCEYFQLKKEPSEEKALSIEEVSKRLFGGK
jgi:hypothetical protein